jgi:hypothetical protein
MPFEITVATDEHKYMQTNYKSVFTLLVLYGSGTLSLRIREGHKLMESENRGLRGEVSGDWKKLRNDELHYRIILCW